MANTIRMAEGVVTAYLNGIELTSDATDIQLSLPRTVQSVKTFGENQVIPSTQHDVSATFSAVLDYADNTLEETLYSTIASTTTAAFTTGYGTTAGSRTYTVIGHQDSAAYPVSLDTAIMVNGGINGESFIRGRYLCRNVAITGTGAQTGIQFTGAEEVIAAAQTMAAVMHLTVDNVTSATVVVEKSTDSTDGSDGTWNAVTGLSFSTAAVGHEIDQADAGATLAQNNWLRVNCTAFTGTTMTVTVVAGRLED